MIAISKEFSNCIGYIFCLSHLGVLLIHLKLLPHLRKKSAFEIHKSKTIQRNANMKQKI